MRSGGEDPQFGYNAATRTKVAIKAALISELQKDRS